MKKIIYLLLALLGTIVPISHFISFIMEKGLDYKLFLNHMFLNDISSFFSDNVLISALVLLVFVILENIKEPIRFSWLALIGTCFIGISFGLPFFLFLREASFRQNSSKMLTYQVNHNRL